MEGLRETGRIEIALGNVICLFWIGRDLWDRDLVPWLFDLRVVRLGRRHGRLREGGQIVLKCFWFLGWVCFVEWWGF